MIWFKKKESEIVPQPPSEIKHECSHKWKDFDWYIDFIYNRYYGQLYGQTEIKIIEPYVCVLCGKREDKQLMCYYNDKISEEDARKQLREITDEHKSFLKSRLQIEDEIADMQHHIDREYLQIMENLFPHRVGK